MMAWVRFLHTYYGFLRSSEECFAVDTTERKILNDFMFFTGKAFLTTRLDDISPAWNTEGFLLMLFRAWELSLGYYIEKGDPNFMTHCVLLVPEEYTRAQCEEAIEGSGGSLKHLARLLTRNLVLATPLLVKDFKHQLLVHRTCCAISGIDAALGVPGSNKPDHWPLMRAVMASDGVRELTNIFCVLADSGKTTRDIEGLWEEVVQKVVQVIGYAFFMGPEHVHPAIEAGFLVGVVDCGYGRIADSLFKRLEYLLSDLLSCMTIFLDVHDALVRAVEGIGKQRTSTEVFRNSRIFKAWRRFEGVLSMVGKMVMLFRARQATLRVCDNVRCGRMGERETFRKCAGCNMRVYCSPECQRADWKEGRHRSGCDTARYTHIGIFYHPKLATNTEIIVLPSPPKSLLQTTTLVLPVHPSDILYHARRGFRP
ncbi:hypothetical protein C8F01DRAFT_1145100 [Mycena amicta]|nr:hypothetical protein C8F01DRAFT_1145100 [Mycena amicta]